MVTFAYSVQDDFPNHAVDPVALRDELIYDFNFSPPGISVDGDVCSISFEDELNGQQQIALTEAVAAHTGAAKPFEKKHYEQEYFNTRIIRDTWWARSSGATLSIKVEETLYTYSGSRLMGETRTTYNRDGSTASVKSWVFKQEKIGATLRVRKVEQ